MNDHFQRIRRRAVWISLTAFLALASALVLSWQVSGASASMPAFDHGDRKPAPSALDFSTGVTATVAYTITDLGVIIPQAINDQGEVLGFDFPQEKLWLPEPAYGMPAGLNDLNFPNLIGIGDINNSGTMAGSLWDPNLDCSDGWRAATWQWNEGTQQFDTNILQPSGGWEEAAAWALNNAGTVVGSAECKEDTGDVAARWQNGIMTTLGTLGGEDSYATDINDNGQIVGVSEVGNAMNEDHAFLWQAGTMTDLGTLAGTNGGGNSSVAQAINEQGQVIGSSNDRPFLWLPAPAYDLPAGMHDLAPFSPDPNPGQVYGINSQGQVVGQVSFGAGHKAFLWDQGIPHDLNDLIDPASGWDLVRATAINENGQIVGFGIVDGQQRGFMLTPVSSWTVMFYLAGDNDLSASYPPILNQLEAAADNPAVNLLVLWDGPPIADSAYIEVQHDMDLYNSANYTEGDNYWSQNELDTSVKSTLTNFLSWGMSNYPADHYALILDDHGSGLGGGLVDDNSGFDMDLVEMQQAFQDTPELFNQKLDVLYMAMCLMGMVEDAYQFRDYADYYVASEDLQWSFSLPYHDYIANISAGDTGADVAANFADAYANVAASSGKPFTISAADMSQLSTLVAATDLLANALTADMDAISSTLTTVHGAVQRFDNELPAGIDLQDTYIDLYDFAELVSVALPGHPDIVDGAQAVMDAIDTYVIYESHASTAGVGLDRSQGVSIFFPTGASSFYNNGNYDFAAGANWPSTAGRSLDLTGISGGWGAMLVSYFEATQPGGPDDPTPPEPLPKLDPFSHRTFLPVVARP